MRILTVNIHKGFSLFNRRFVLDELREAIRSTHADIVFLQEVIGENNKKAKKHSNWPSESQCEYLADEIWKEYAYGKNAIYPEGHHGNAILSKFPIVQQEKVDITTNIFEQRGFLYCKLELPKEANVLHCFCVHLSLTAYARKKQMNALETYIKKNVPATDRLILAGDFNDWQNSASHFLQDNLQVREVFIDVEGRIAKSFPRIYPFLSLDRIYQRGFVPMDVAIHHKDVWKKLSDHAALSVSLK